MSKVKFITAIYSDIHGTELGGRPSRYHHYRWSLLSILQMTDAYFVLYTSKAEYEDLYNFFYTQNNIPTSLLEIRIFELETSRYFNTLNSKKDLDKMKVLDRCYEIQYNKFFWIQDEPINDFTHIYWIDAGLSHVGLIPDTLSTTDHSTGKYYTFGLFNNNYLNNLIKYTDDKIYLIGKDNSGANYWERPMPEKYYDTMDASVHIIGGIFGGKIAQIKGYAHLFEEQLKTLLNDETQLFYEERIMSLLYQNYKDRFILSEFDIWWYNTNGPYPEDHEIYKTNKSFYQILTELQ